MISRNELLRQLGRRIHEIQSGRGLHIRSRISTGIAALDELLPECGLKKGTLIELLSVAPGAGVWTMGTVIAKNVCAARKALVITDSEKQFYPPAAVRLGLDLSRLIVVRPIERRDAYRAIVESLRCAAVGAVLSWQVRLSMLDFRRLQLAAESGGGVGILLRPIRALHMPSSAAVRLLVSPVASADLSPIGNPLDKMRERRATACKQKRVSGVVQSAFGEVAAHGSEARFLVPPLRYVRVDVARCWGGKYGQSLILEIDHETGHVHIPARVAPAAVVARSARTSG